ncbi:MAG: redoxin domain-containing protein [Planctomycetota bacterium]|nr:redoxin domain-containing protein [Planctomycetota bacterium]
MLLRSALVCAAFFAALPTPPALAQTPAQTKPATLSVGDAAPALAINKWVKGEPVTGFQKGKTYIVEFWATWCGPCIAGMPHLSEMQKKYADKGLTIIGVTAEDSRGNTLEKVEAMVKDKGDKMAYTVAWDDGRKTNDAYMRAAQQNGIPCCFLVDANGKIAYIGHPARIDATLETVVAGKHDLAALAASAKKAKEQEAQGLKLQNDLNKAAASKDWESAIKACDDMIALDADQFGGAAIAKFQILANEVKDMDRAHKWAKEAFEGVCKDSPELLNGLAWTMVDPDAKYEKRDADLALKIALRAAELSKEKDPSILDTLARAWFTKGDPAKAVETQRKAVALDPRLSDSLKEYEEALAKRG